MNTDTVKGARFDMASNLCFLCLQVIAKDKESDGGRWIKLATLSDLLAPSSPSNNPTSHDQFDDDETCGFCPDCYPVVGEVEKIREQISLLEDQAKRKVTQIRDKISNHLPNGGGNKILDIRNRVLRTTASSGELGNQQDDNFFTSQFDVKVEQEVDRVDDDQPFEHLKNSFGNTTSNFEHDAKEEDDELDQCGDDFEEFDFCITPNAQKSRNTNKTRKQSAEIRPMLAKRIKREVRPILERTRSSPRIKKTIPAPVKVTKILKVSLERIPPVKKPKKVRPYTCTSCTAAFSTSGGLTRHIGMAHGLIPCPTCDAKFSSVDEKYAHMREAHQVHPHQCALCGNKFGHAGRLAVHMVVRHEKGEKKFSCVKCDKRFVLEENFKRHVNLHEVQGIKPLVCDVCDSRFENEERMEIHIATHGPKFPCNQCGKKFYTRPMLARHKLTHTKEKLEKCPLCDVSFRDKITVERHIARKHSNLPASHICHICGKAFHIPFDLKSHIDRHEGKLQVTCDTCGEKLTDRNALASHRVKVHGADPLVCDECGAVFTSPSGLKSHKQTHEGIKPFKCDFCDARFLRKTALQTHMTSHTTERPFPCSHCEKAFKTRSQVNQHEKLIHTNFVRPTPHQCPHCEKAYPRKSYLEGHIRSAHTGERPFICAECGTGFVLKTMLNQHLKVSHGVGLTTEKKERLPRSKKDFDALESADHSE